MTLLPVLSNSLRTDALVLSEKRLFARGFAHELLGCKFHFLHHSSNSWYWRCMDKASASRSGTIEHAKSGKICILRFRLKNMSSCE
jgi:hypothetical protein